jgi:hypothetical protein
MVDQVQTTMSGLEQYRMVMNIINTWEMYKMHAMIAFGILLLITIVLYIRKSCWKKWLLFFTILAGLTIAGLEGFKMYVAHAKKEAVKEMVTTTVVETLGKMAEVK